MITHSTRMLAIDLQAALRGNDGPAIVATLNKLLVALGGNTVDENWSPSLQIMYLLAVVTSHLPLRPSIVSAEAEVIPLTPEQAQSIEEFTEEFNKAHEEEQAEKGLHLVPPVGPVQ